MGRVVGVRGVASVGAAAARRGRPAEEEEEGEDARRQTAVHRAPREGARAKVPRPGVPADLEPERRWWIRDARFVCRMPAPRHTLCRSAALRGVLGQLDDDDGLAHG